ncbi:dihydropteroate synthase [Arthrobacter sp. GCM10027362]|uniref:dihydropteroate synthase n=1 Tax=Arthrobacter sp. GCM10027362 TaxID=3273379 RepID=UPI00363C2D32
MDSLAAVPGTGPATSPLPPVRTVRAPKAFSDLPADRAVVMAILNVTPDSFSDGGEHIDREAAIAHGLKLHYGGADIIDIGGESTRPGHTPVSPEEEQARILPVIEALVKAGALISVDTMHVATARAALDAGAAIVNDVSGQNYEPGMPELVAERKVPYILMHSRGSASNEDPNARYDDVVAEVLAELAALRDRFVAAGVAPEQIILDPGLGFSKTGEHNWALLRALPQLTGLGHKVLVGASRKRFLGSLLSVDGRLPAPKERDEATLAVTALSAGNGAWGVRVHDAGPNLDAVKVAAAWAG